MDCIKMLRKLTHIDNKIIRVKEGRNSATSLAHRDIGIGHWTDKITSSN